MGAVVLALATLAAVIFALLNFDQRARFELVDDGVAWLDTIHGVQAWQVSPNSPAARAGIHAGDQILAINGSPVTRSVQVTSRLTRAGLWSQVRYKLARNGEEFETPLITTPAEKPVSIENALRVVGLLYLFIGLFIFIRRWNAPRAVHFYVFCLVSFILYSFHYSGKLDTFDQEIYWANIVARLLAPALLVHFALVFPGRSETTVRSSSIARRLSASGLAFRHASQHGAECAWFCALAGFARFARQDRVELSRRFVPHRGNCVLQQLPGSAFRCSPAAIEMAYGRNARGQLAIRAALHCAFRV